MLGVCQQARSMDVLTDMEPWDAGKRVWPGAGRYIRWLDQKSQCCVLGVRARLVTRVSSVWTWYNEIPLEL